MPIYRVNSTKFLGIIIHENLSWKQHVSTICSKTSKIIGTCIICKARKYFCSKTLLTLYNSLFLPYLNYCNLIWASTYDSHIELFFFFILPPETYLQCVYIGKITIDTKNM